MEEQEMSDGLELVLEEIVPARRGWAHELGRGDTLIITDLEGQQAVDFLCFDVDDPGDRYSATNTIKVQGKVYVALGTVLYADSGKALMTVVEDTFGRHDTIYGCCSNPNNRLRYGVQTTESCYSNFETILAPYGLGREAIVANVNWFMSVPIQEDGGAGVAEVALHPGSRVALRAECGVLAALSNCPQMHNPCNGYSPTPILVQVFRVADGGEQN
jgi:uncharacterized protein